MTTSEGWFHRLLEDGWRGVLPMVAVIGPRRSEGPLTDSSEKLLQSQGMRLPLTGFGITADEIQRGTILPPLDLRFATGLCRNCWVSVAVANQGSWAPRRSCLAPSRPSYYAGSGGYPRKYFFIMKSFLRYSPLIRWPYGEKVAPSIPRFNTSDGFSTLQSAR